ncbi:hypothetical protein EA660_03295 [Pseudoxanthomonas winnipegensis]|uniref:Uncharacterized protein n=1 Tax=Pseudoxanthomonas winnipegensis TaxID=2480810 RepID=A0A4Q8LHN3_9GAMM|nr:hypothetical protein EA660_03295 [Pseudoxanthomonas winnipegensis]
MSFLARQELCRGVSKGRRGFWSRESGIGNRESGFGIRDSGFGQRRLRPQGLPPPLRSRGGLGRGWLLLLLLLLHQRKSDAFPALPFAARKGGGGSVALGAWTANAGTSIRGIDLPPLGPGPSPLK